MESIIGIRYALLCTNDKMPALSSLLLIGVSLIAEGFEQHIPKGYIYFVMAFSVFVEMLNLKMKSKAKPVALRNRCADDK